MLAGEVCSYWEQEQDALLHILHAAEHPGLPRVVSFTSLIQHLMQTSKVWGVLLKRRYSHSTAAEVDVLQSKLMMQVQANEDSLESQDLSQDHASPRGSARV